MNENVVNGLLVSIAFSIFGMLLIFGLGFVFPTINPYVVIKWIIIVCAVVFAAALIKFLVSVVLTMTARRKTKGKKSAKK